MKKEVMWYLLIFIVVSIALFFLYLIGAHITGLATATYRTCLKGPPIIHRNNDTIFITCTQFEDDSDGSTLTYPTTLNLSTWCNENISSVTNNFSSYGIPSINISIAKNGTIFIHTNRSECTEHFGIYPVLVNVSTIDGLSNTTTINFAFLTSLASPDFYIVLAPHDYNPSVGPSSTSNWDIPETYNNSKIVVFINWSPVPHSTKYYVFYDSNLSKIMNITNANCLNYISSSSLSRFTINVNDSSTGSCGSSGCYFNDTTARNVQERYYKVVASAFDVMCNVSDDIGGKYTYIINNQSFPGGYHNISSLFLFSWPFKSKIFLISKSLSGGRYYVVKGNESGYLIDAPVKCGGTVDSSKLYMMAASVPWPPTSGIQPLIGFQTDLNHSYFPGIIRILNLNLTSSSPPRYLYYGEWISNRLNYLTLEPIKQYALASFDPYNVTNVTRPFFNMTFTGVLYQGVQNWTIKPLRFNVSGSSVYKFPITVPSTRKVPVDAIWINCNPRYSGVSSANGSAKICLDMDMDNICNETEPHATYGYTGSSPLPSSSSLSYIDPVNTTNKYLFDNLCNYDNYTITVYVNFSKIYS